LLVDRTTSFCLILTIFSIASIYFFGFFTAIGTKLLKLRNKMSNQLTKNVKAPEHIAPILSVSNNSSGKPPTILQIGKCLSLTGLFDCSSDGIGQ
jgi:hypothetical protein